MANLSSYDTKSSLEHWRVLLGENIRIEAGDLPKGSAQSRPTSKGANTGGLAEGSTWNRACYAYGVDVCLMDDETRSSDADTSRVVRGLIEKIPKLVKKIAGKSIPMEVCLFHIPSSYPCF